MTASPTPPSAPEWVAILDGAGSLCVVAGVMAVLALIVTPEVWPTFVPLAVAGIGGGSVAVRFARRRVSKAPPG